MLPPNLERPDLIRPFGFYESSSPGSVYIKKLLAGRRCNLRGSKKLPSIAPLFHTYRQSNSQYSESDYRCHEKEDRVSGCKIDKGRGL